MPENEHRGLAAGGPRDGQELSACARFLLIPFADPLVGRYSAHRYEWQETVGMWIYRDVQRK